MDLFSISGSIFQGLSKSVNAFALSVQQNPKKFDFGQLLLETYQITDFSIFTKFVPFGAP